MVNCPPLPTSSSPDDMDGNAVACLLVGIVENIIASSTIESIDLLELQVIRNL
jgi:hypothetical protein